MMEVIPSLANPRTRFQTFITSPQVVSTMWQPRDSTLSMKETGAPKAGTMTTSSSVSSSYWLFIACHGSETIFISSS